MELPCIVESHKTLDKKSLYKTGDICQVRKSIVFVIPGAHELLKAVKEHGTYTVCSAVCYHNSNAKYFPYKENKISEAFANDV